MFFVEKEAFAQYEIKKSKFFAHIVPYSEFKEKRELLKEAHPKARHIVWAFRYLNEYEQIVEDLSDDGEPKGSSAPVVLDTLRGKEIVNSAILIVRYFGGIKLGIGGLVRAYGASANLAINEAKLIKYEKREPFSFFTPFNLISKTEYFLQKNQIPFSEREFDANGAKWRLEVTQNQLQLIKSFLKTNNI
jgi:uncharacterized YigZ family protein